MELLMSVLNMSSATRTSASRRRPLKAALVVAVVAVTIVVFLMPYVWMVASSFKSSPAIFADLDDVSWRTFVPVDPTLDGYVTLFVDRGLGRALVNSLIIGVVQVGGALVLCSLAAYALTRMRFRGQSILFALILVTFMVPVEALVVPLYSVMTGLGLQDTLAAIALPWVASVFGLFLLRQHFDEIPRELDEAAKLDGAGHLRILWQVILPNVKPALASMALILFLLSWNGFLWPLVIISSPENMPVQVAIAQTSSPTTQTDWGAIFAGATVATIPLIVLFLVLQRYFVQGFAASGLK
jgi:ABC-type glycerol-3-phosphate transport system permease component